MPLLVSQPGKGTILDRLKSILNRSQDLAPLAGAVKKIALDANRDRAMKGLGFDGQPYVRLAKSTLADRKRLGYPPGPPLNRQGPNARVITGCRVYTTVTPGRLQLFKNWPMVPWMQYHIDPVPGGRLPQRNPAGFSSEELDRIRSMLPKYVLFGR
jgi:hypothetical protein